MKTLDKTIETSFNDALLDLRKNKLAKKISVTKQFKNESDYLFNVSLTFMHQYTTISFSSLKLKPFEIKFTSFNENYLKSIGKKSTSIEKLEIIRNKISNIFSEVIIIHEK